jgi:hypothetical protein
LSGRRSRAGILVVVGFATLTVLFTGQFPPFSSPNELTRLETVHAAVEYGTFSIDRSLTVLGEQEDKSESAGHFYSNKAPGMALAAIPFYRFLRTFFPPPHAADSTIFILLRLLVVSTVCVLALLRFTVRVERRWPGRGVLTAAAAAFGTPYLFYARSFLSHAWAAALVFLAWDLTILAREREASRLAGALAGAAGLVIGWAAISEYPVALLALALAWTVLIDRSPRRLAFFLLGAAVPLALLLAYDAVCFGSPFVLSSSRESLPEYSALASRGFFGFVWPQPRIALAYLVHPARGVLLFSPFLLWAAAGFVRGWRRDPDRREVRFAAPATLLFCAVLCGYPNWHGGWALGNRYLLPVLFLAAAAIPLALESPLSRVFFAGAATFSIGVHALAAATWPHFPLNVPWPPASGSAWFLVRGWVAPGVLPGGADLLLALAIPLAVLVAALSQLPLRPGRWLLALGAGLALLTATLVRPPELSFGGRLWRAAVYGRFSGRDPQRIELRRVIAEAATPSEKRRAADAWRLFGIPDRPVNP